MDDRLATRPLVGPQAKFDDGWTRAGQRAKFMLVKRRCARGLESIEWSMLCCPALAELGNGCGVERQRAQPEMVKRRV